MQRHSPDWVRQLASEGQLADWVHDFLLTDGNNAAMAEGLRAQTRYWLGPIEVPLDHLDRACGPEAEMEYQEDSDQRERRVSAMLVGIQGGWSPAPLIAQYTAEGHLSLRDGNHRHEALRRHGLEAYWCVIWCDTDSLRQELQLRYPQAEEARR